MVHGKRGTNLAFKSASSHTHVAYPFIGGPFAIAMHCHCLTSLCFMMPGETCVTQTYLLCNGPTRSIYCCVWYGIIIIMYIHCSIHDN